MAAIITFKVERRREIIIRIDTKPDAGSSELSYMQAESCKYRSKNNRQKTTISTWLNRSHLAPKSIDWLGKEKVYTVVLSTSFDILANPVRGKIFRAMNYRFSGVQNDQTLINSLPIDEMAGRSELPAYLLETPPPSQENIKRVHALQCWSKSG